MYARINESIYISFYFSFIYFFIKRKVSEEMPFNSELWVRNSNNFRKNMLIFRINKNYWGRNAAKFGINNLYWGNNFGNENAELRGPAGF